MSRDRYLLSVVVVVGGLLCGPIEIEAQKYTLSNPTATHPEGLSSIAGLRELPDGRVMVADRLGQALMIIGLDDGAADTIGRTGEGPGEYRAPGALFPWLGDSTIMIDMGNTRFTPIGPDGGAGVSTPLMTQNGDVMTLVMPEGTDKFGNIYSQARSFGLQRPGMGGSTDSSFVARVNLASGDVDTVAALKQAERRTQSAGGNVAMIMIPFSPQDDWAVSWDGNVGVVRSTDYRVEWLDPAGSVRTGPAVSYEPVRITQEDKDDWLEARSSAQAGGIFISVGTGGGGGGGGARATTTSGRNMRLAGPQVEDGDWPEVKPAFPNGAVSASPEGNLWVRRHLRAGAAPEYDVFDGEGNRIHTVVLPEDTRVVGFGNGVVYLSRTDEFDLQWLERYDRHWLSSR